MAVHPYHIVDVFTTERFGGNQLAVFPEADKLPESDFQSLANELNFSETAFVLTPTTPDADFRVRIFTPQIELPMAGHPSVGTAFVLKRIGLATSGTVIFEEGVGLIEMQYEGGDGTPLTIWMTQHLPEFGPTFEDRALTANLLSLTEADLLGEQYPIEMVSTGVPFLYIPVASLNALERASIRRDIWQEHFADWATPHIFAFTPQTLDPADTVHSRMFAPAMGIVEDPATGAASGPLGAYLWKYGLVAEEDITHMISEQGYEMGRPSQIHIRLEVSGGEISSVAVGGSCVYIGHGVIIDPLHSR